MGIATATPRTDVPKPTPFIGKRAFDEFVWEVKQYFNGVNIMDDVTKSKTATKYLGDMAALWWRS